MVYGVVKQNNGFIAHHGVLEEGVHFIQKPFAVRDLARKIREIFL